MTTAPWTFVSSQCRAVGIGTRRSQRVRNLANERGRERLQAFAFCQTFDVHLLERVEVITAIANTRGNYAFFVPKNLGELANFAHFDRAQERGNNAKAHGTRSIGTPLRARRNEPSRVFLA